MKKQSFWYLGSPYSKYPHGKDNAFQAACKNAAFLIKAGVRVFCPIAHSHPVAELGKVDPDSHAIWLAADQPFIDHACGLIVLGLEGWKQSIGLQFEIFEFIGTRRPIVYMEPGLVPLEVLPR